jgi:hypothetical protein
LLFCVSARATFTYLRAAVGGKKSTSGVLYFLVWSIPGALGSTLRTFSVQGAMEMEEKCAPLAFALLV